MGMCGKIAQAASTRPISKEERVGDYEVSLEAESDVAETVGGGRWWTNTTL